ncbi:hypothetical protein TREPR_2284 [Treponema primitia ZAS-2]|uniref:Uncharacterized protein n=1 Tax=Treponema primitia (strain ATCC BAA-887 / DSM 12427 / ZAS-2) TaxID=545694 RepID=F5YI19_TREPZ|nr:hypothetical protein TREPR_2284 [Treponema primitia ZAS-2]
MPKLIYEYDIFQKYVIINYSKSQIYQNLSSNPHLFQGLEPSGRVCREFLCWGDLPDIAILKKVKGKGLPCTLD